MKNLFTKWWRVVRVTDRDGNIRCKFPILLEDSCYAYGLHLELCDRNCEVFAWQIVRDCGKYAVWDDFTTSRVESITQTEGDITVTTRNSVYYFKEIKPPALPEAVYEEDYLQDEYEEMLEKSENDVCVTPTMYGKLLMLRAEQQKNNLYRTVEDIRRALSNNRRFKIRSDYSIVDLINDSIDADRYIQVISDWLTARAVAFRTEKGKSDEKELYNTFFVYTLQMLTKGDVSSNGIDDLIKMAEVLQEEPSLYVGTFKNCIAETEHKDMLLDVQDWIGSEPIIPADFEVYVIAAVAAFVGALPDPLTSHQSTDEQIA